MILVAAAGVALMALRDTLNWKINTGSPVWDRLKHWADESNVVLGALSTALLICRLRRPRPRRRRLWLLPGTITALAAALVSLQLFAESLAAAVSLWLRSLDPASPQHGEVPFPPVLFEFEVHYLSAWESVAWGVGLPWLVMFLGGRWRPEASWVDRLGRALGVCWIGLFLALQWREAFRLF
jgi:hypothetical protein